MPEAGGQASGGAVSTSTATPFIALLRGINVGRKQIKMAELKQLLEAQGFARVQTYIQSGNVLFASAAAEEPLRRQLEREIAVTFGFPVSVILRTADELEQVVARCPFDAGALGAGERLYVTLLAATPAPAAAEQLPEGASEMEACRLIGRDVYLLLRQSTGLTTFTLPFLERRLGVAATSRNWRTITRLAELGQALRSAQPADSALEG